MAQGPEVGDGSGGTRAQALRARREALKLSQEELAFRSEVHRTYISELERGIKNPSMTTLQKLAVALDTTKTALVRETERREGKAP
ncbi:MAG: helix-turn-helix transcriptional regulator [Planctomycetes bacterium]|nr:helix-turn-helix transcriptional regulator [Planctomycetota bacterium]